MFITLRFRTSKLQFVDISLTWNS